MMTEPARVTKPIRTPWQWHKLYEFVKERRNQATLRWVAPAGPSVEGVNYGDLGRYARAWYRLYDDCQQAMQQPAQQWQPIDTAPRDGSEFMGWLTLEDQGFFQPRVKYDENGNPVIWGRVDYDRDGWEHYSHLQLIHWMPHPKPPTIP